jgi:hypothetical protein
MWIMAGGPYGTAAKWAVERAANLRRMEEAAVEASRRCRPSEALSSWL